MRIKCLSKQTTVCCRGLMTRPTRENSPLFFPFLSFCSIHYKKEINFELHSQTVALSATALCSVHCDSRAILEHNRHSCCMMSKQADSLASIQFQSTGASALLFIHVGFSLHQGFHSQLSLCAPGHGCVCLTPVCCTFLHYLQCSQANWILAARRRMRPL